MKLLIKSVFLSKCFIFTPFLPFQLTPICSGFGRRNTNRVFSQSKKPEDYQINVAAFLCWSADFISKSFQGDRLKARCALQRLTDRRLWNHKAESFTQSPLGSCHSNMGEEQPLYSQRSPPSDLGGVWKASWVRVWGFADSVENSSSSSECFMYDYFLIFYLQKCKWILIFMSAQSCTFKILLKNFSLIRAWDSFKAFKGLPPARRTGQDYWNLNMLSPWGVFCCLLKGHSLRTNWREECTLSAGRRLWVSRRAALMIS